MRRSLPALLTIASLLSGCVRSLDGIGEAAGAAAGEAVGEAMEDTLDDLFNWGGEPGDPANGILAAYTLTADGGDSVFVRASFSYADTGGSFPMPAGTVSAWDDVASVTLDPYVSGILYYSYYSSGVLPYAGPGEGYHVTADKKDWGGERDTEIALPPEFELLPLAALPVSRSREEVTLRWTEPTGGRIQYLVDGSCIDQALSGSTNDDGSFTIPADTLEAVDDVPTCFVHVTLTRSQTGDVHPFFAGGQWIAEQTRTRYFASIP